MAFQLLAPCARYKEAINECSAALELNPNYTRALIRRAKAYEQMQHYKQALSDLQKINRGEDATPDTRVCCAGFAACRLRSTLLRTDAVTTDNIEATPALWGVACLTASPGMQSAYIRASERYKALRY